MNRMQYQWIVMVLSVVVSLANAGSVFFDGFENNNVGDIPPLHWEHSLGWGGGGVITNVPVHRGVRSLCIDDTTSSWAIGFKSSYFTEQTNGVIEWEFYLRPTTNDQQVECMADDTNSKPAAVVLFRDDGNIGYGSRSSWNVNTSVPYLVDAWNHVLVKIDLDSGVWNLTVNGTVIATGIDSGNPNGDNAGKINTVKFTGSSSAITSFYVDDVALDYIEPDAIFSDGFEFNAVGDIPPLHWVHNQGWGGNGAVTNSPVYSGVRSLRIDDSSSLSSGFQSSYFTEQTNGVREWEFYLRPITNDQQIECMADDTNSKPAAVVLFRDDGNIGYGSRSSWNVNTSVPYLVNDWNHVLVRIDLDSRKWNLTVNGTVIVSGIDSGNPGGDNAGKINTVKFTGGSSAQTSFYMDDVSLAVFHPGGTIIIIK